MREIKFRAWIDAEKRIIGWKDLLIEKDDEDGFFLWVKDDPNDYHSGATSERDFVLMQHTGLKDKNGTEIYDRDIVQVEEKIVISGKMTSIKVNKVVKYKEDYAQFLLYANEIGEHLTFATFGEVIGNIYENPELLEEKQ